VTAREPGLPRPIASVKSLWRRPRPAARSGLAWLGARGRRRYWGDRHLRLERHREPM